MGEKKGFFSRLVEGLTKTRNNIVSGIDSVFHGFSKIDDEFYEELEEILIMGDLGEPCERACRMQTASDRQHQTADAGR